MIVKTVKIVADSDNVQTKIIQLEQHSKTFDKVICAVDILGKFNGRIEVFECDCKDTDEEQWERIWCFVEEQNIYTFYLTASDKKLLSKIYKESPNGEICEFDTLLSKKIDLSEENIEFLKSSSIYNFKFGRLITDEISNYNLFLADDIIYGLKVKFANGAINSKEFLQLLNYRYETLSFSGFIEKVNSLIIKNGLEIIEADISVRNKNMEEKYYVEDTEQTKRLKSMCLNKAYSCGEDIYNLLNIRVLHDLVLKIQTRKKIKLIGELAFGKNVISTEEQFLYILSKYIGYVKETYHINHIEVLCVIKETSLNKYNKVLFNLKDYHKEKNYEFYIWEFKIFFKLYIVYGKNYILFD